jgi:hypothetical protein
MKLPRNEPGPRAREGSRPRPAAAGLLTKPRMFCNRGRKYPFGLRHVLTARGDPTSPGRIRNERKTTGYVGQAARPPRIARAHHIGARFRTHIP